jgi:sporulation protein YlmC with PRC-barrel domain
MAAQSTGSWVGHTLIDRDGEHVGTVEQVYRDQETDRPTWAVVSPGTRFVPLAEASEEGDETLKVAATKGQVDYAPDVEDKDRLSPDEEARLHGHYAEDAPRGSFNGGTSRGRGGRDADRQDGGRSAMEGVRERQHEEYGGFNFGAAFFGWLVAVGIAALLTAILAAAGTVGIVGGIVLVLILVLAYYSGGYVAGRMSRFDGARQGLGVWLFGLLITIAAAVAGAVFGSKYNVLSKLDLPRIPVDEGSLTTGGLIALAVVLIGTLLGAMAGGKTGERYHKKVDRAGSKNH